MGKSQTDQIRVTRFVNRTPSVISHDFPTFNTPYPLSRHTLGFHNQEEVLTHLHSKT